MLQALNTLSDELIDILKETKDWDRESLEKTCKDFAEANALKLGKVMGTIRARITGSHASPSMFEVMDILGQEECVRRLEAR